MSKEIVAKAVEELRDDFEAEGTPLVEINLGLCSDFADALESRLAEQDVTVDTWSLDYYWAEDGGVDAAAELRRAATTLPPGIDWGYLESVDFANSASHTWVEFEGICFDAEQAAGVSTPFDLPSVRHALTEIIEEEALRPLVDEHEWWTESLKIRAEREKSFPDSANRFQS